MSGFVGTAFAQTVSVEKIFTEKEIDEMRHKGVLISLNEGTMMIELFPEDAPNTVYNFLKLVESGYYDGTAFHRIIPGFMIQGGDPLTKEDVRVNWGSGGPGYWIVAEFNSLKHDRGIVSMARQQSPNTAGSQFFIVHEDSHFLDGQYTAFGRLVPLGSSFKMLDNIASLPTDSKDIPLDVSQARILKAKIVDPYTPPQFGAPDRNESITSSVKVAGGTTENYVNTLHKVSFDLPYRWAIISNQEGPDLNMVIEPTDKEHNAQTQIELSGFTPQIIVLSETRDPSMESNGVPTAFFSIAQGEDPKILSNYIFENDYGRKAHLMISTQNLETPTELAQFKILQLHFVNAEKSYTIAYVNLTDWFRYEVGAFNQVIENFQVVFDGEMQPIFFVNDPVFKQIMADAKVKPVPEPLPPARIGGCLIATAAFGSEMAPQVQFLRELRDNTVLQTESGSAFMTGFNQFYYSFSPAVADYERENPAFKETVKLALTPMLASLAILNYVDIDSEAEILGYGIGIILLNIGMYFVAPAIIIIKIKNRN